MAQHDAEFDGGYDEGLDPEGPSADDLDRFGSEFITCPNCHAEIYDQAPQCPHCRHSIGTPVGMRRWKGTLLIVILLVIALFGLTGFIGAITNP